MTYRITSDMEPSAILVSASNSDATTRVEIDYSAFGPLDVVWLKRWQQDSGDYAAICNAHRASALRLTPVTWPFAHSQKAQVHAAARRNDKHFSLLLTLLPNSFITALID